MGPRADKHDDVYDRQIRLWGADAQVCVANYAYRELSCFFLVAIEIITMLIIISSVAIACSLLSSGNRKKCPMHVFCTST